MNRAERRRQDKGTPKPHQDEGTPKPTLEWKTIFDAKPMAEGMPPHFLLYLLNEKDVFGRHGKLLTAALWLQSQMVALICFHESPELKESAARDNGKQFPSDLSRAATLKLEQLSSESLRGVFLECFDDEMTQELKDDLARVTFARDALAHGYLSLFRQIMGREDIAWSPRPSSKREGTLDAVLGPRHGHTFLAMSLSDSAFEEEIARICRVMDFIASQLKQWDIPYAVFA